MHNRLNDVIQLIYFLSEQFVMESDSFVSKVSNRNKMEQIEEDANTDHEEDSNTAATTTQWLSTSGKESVPLSRGAKMAKYQSDKPGKTASARLRKAVSLDCPGKEKQYKFGVSLGSGTVRCVRRVTKRLDQSEPMCGYDTAGYEAIRKRVLHERAVVNAIETLQERWRMLMYLHDDCIELTEGVKERRIRKLCIQRQFELIMVISVFIIMCVPISLISVFICRLI